MSLYDAVSDLPLTVEGHERTRRERDTSSDFTRVSTTFELSGAGETGRGEDVTYDTPDHDALAEADPAFAAFEGEWTFEEFSAALDDVDLFPEPPERETAHHYRRWAVESAALDLACKQAGRTLGEVLDREYDSLRFIISTRLGDAGFDRIEQLLDVNPEAEFKLDPTDDWDADLVERLADTGRVRVLDLKGLYEGTQVDMTPDPDLYRLVVEGLPDAVVEDPRLTDDTRPVFDGHEDRVSWDYPITGVESVEDLPFEPDWLNIKPSRFGTVESLFDTLEYAAERDIALYGGGQFELGVGRDQIQALAALFYPDGPNDVAPGGYNDPEPSPDLPTSPLDPPVGFGVR
ncbi:hypothetical protein [Haloglomus litoreum]|uniref:hypothetical protein n=1 Tax=Haloglomus litoreum TaxID=3034026 RepID=UPI0023E8AED4|nr:hypothetical protein [Haloglomus sp. DT116]